MKNSTLCLFIPLLFVGCGEGEPGNTNDAQPIVPAVVVDTVPKDEHERLLEQEKVRFENLEDDLVEIRRESVVKLSSKEQAIEILEVKVLELTASLEAYKKQVRDSKVSLNELRKLGSAEYKEIYERAKTVDNESAITLYEEFIEQFPDSPITGKARSQLRKHLAERKVLENRKNATTLRTWEIKLKGEGMFVREVSATKLFELIGRAPDSSKRGSSSEYRQFTYVWRDYVLGQGGEYYDLLIHRTNDRVDRVSFSE
jgi:hypothetical protein